MHILHILKFNLPEEHFKTIKTWTPSFQLPYKIELGQYYRWKDIENEGWLFTNMTLKKNQNAKNYKNRLLSRKSLQDRTSCKSVCFNVLVRYKRGETTCQKAPIRKVQKKPTAKHTTPYVSASCLPDLI